MKKTDFLFITGITLSVALTGCSFANEVSNDVKEEVSVAVEHAKDDIEDAKEDIKDAKNDIDNAKEEISKELSEAREDVEEALGIDGEKESESSFSEHEEHYTFRNDRLLEQHYEKHGEEMGFSSSEEYEEAACDVINNPDALHKYESEDNDIVYYVEETNELVIVSEDGYIRTYFEPSDGIRYYNRQ